MSHCFMTSGLRSGRSRQGSCMEPQWSNAPGLMLTDAQASHLPSTTPPTTDTCRPPVGLASAVASATKVIQLRLAAILLPLYDPLRLAEDLAVLDLISGGRLRLTVGLGYRAKEYEQLGVDYKRRVALLEEGVETLKRAWSGEPFEYRNRSVRVLSAPRPTTATGHLHGRYVPGQCSPGGPNRRRLPACGCGDVRVVLEELAALGKPAPDRSEAGFATVGPYIFVSEDPERDWPRIAPFALYDNNEYAGNGLRTSGEGST